jgi:hypothetical protein
MHSLTNKVPIQEISYQYLLDCKATPGCATNENSFNFFNKARNVKIPLLKDYSAWMKRRDQCQTYNEPPANSPMLVDYTCNTSVGDSLTTTCVENYGPMFITMYISSNILQFYRGGLVTSAQCASGNDQVYYPATLTGFNKTGDSKYSSPYWQIRGSFGVNFWGDNGLMYVQKTNGSSGNGPCSVDRYSLTYLVKKY